MAIPGVMASTGDPLFKIPNLLTGATLVASSTEAGTDVNNILLKNTSIWKGGAAGSPWTIDAHKAAAITVNGLGLHGSSLGAFSLSALVKTEAINWTDVYPTPSTSYFYSGCAGNGFLLVGDGNGYIYKSTTGAAGTWANVGRVSAATNRSIAFDGTLFWILTGAGAVYTTPDGVNYTLSATAGVHLATANKIACGEGRVMAIGTLATVPTVAIYDGVSWSHTNTLGLSGNAALSVCYGPSGWVLGGGSGHLSRSQDHGVTWTGIVGPAPSSSISDITYGSGYYVGVGSSNYMIKSVDGLTGWVVMTPPAGFVSESLVGICHSNGFWLTVSSTQNDIATTSDLVTWTQRTSPYTSWSFYGCFASDTTWIAYGQTPNLARSIGTAYTQVYSGSPVDGVTLGTVSQVITSTDWKFTFTGATQPILQYALLR